MIPTTVAEAARRFGDRIAYVTELGWSLSTGKNPGTVNSDRLLAAYMSELPAGVSIDHSTG